MANPVSVRFGLKGHRCRPGQSREGDDRSPYLLLDIAELPPLDEPIPADDHHKHFGGGQTEVTLQLLPDTHTLQLLGGDLNHIPHELPVMPERITITLQ